MKYVRFFHELGLKDIHTAGGKGASLGEMINAGFPIPQGFVITTDAFSTFHNKSFSQEFRKELSVAFKKLDSHLVAVRSSAITEDSPTASWAGQLESYLNIDWKQLFTAIEKCWESVHLKRVLLYAKQNKIPQSKLVLAVIIQQMIESDASGVLFTINPVTNNRNELMIEAGYGLGEMIVQGEITPDNYLIEKKGLQIITSSLGNQKKMLLYKSGKNFKVSVPNHMRNKQILTDDHINELAKLGKKIEMYFGSPQDVEWALKDNKFFIVQSRPITTLTI